jgi:hypothetical protein
MFNRSSVDVGGSPVPTTDIEGGSEALSHNEPERSTLIQDSEPIFDDSAIRDIDNRARFSILNTNVSEDSYEVEDDVAQTLTEITRQRKKQRKKAALRMLVASAVLFVLVAITLGVFFAVRQKQLSAYRSNNSKVNSKSTTAPIPLPYNPSTTAPMPVPYSPEELSPSGTLITTFRPSIFHGDTQTVSSLKPLPYNPPASSPSFQTSPGIPQNVTVETPKVPYTQLEGFCNLDAQNPDMAKCEAECSKGKCCWATKTCIDNPVCESYSPCFILLQSTINMNNTVIGGCASVTSERFPPSFECFPFFMPCYSNADCEQSMDSLGLFVNCTSECSKSQYFNPTDIVDTWNISDVISGIGDMIDIIQNPTYYDDDYRYDSLQNGDDWNLITFDDFENGWGNFRDGGEDSKLITLYDGEESNHVARIRHNEKESILPMKETVNVTQYRALRVIFWVAADGLEPGDMMLLEYSSDGGSNWDVVKQWIFGEDILENGDPYQFNVTFYSTDYDFSAYALIRFRSDANSKEDNFYIDDVSFEGSKKINSDSSDIMAVNFFSYCGVRNETDTSQFVCNPAKVACNSDQDCYENVAATFISITESCGDDPTCIQNAQSAVEYVDCLTECDRPVAATSQRWESITSDDFENGYGNFVDKGGDSEIVSFVDDNNVTTKMVQLKNDNNANSSLPLRDYYDVRKYASLRVNFVLVFQGVESGDTLLLEYSPEPASWLIVEEWVFGGDVLNKNNLPYVQEAIFYNSAYTNFTEQSRIRFRSLGNSNTDHFLIGNIVLSGLTT